MITVDKAWKTKQAEFFAFDKFTLQILANKSGCVQTNLLFFSYTPHLRRKSTVRRCFYHTDLYKMQYFTIFQDKLHSFSIQDHWSTRGPLVKQLKKFPKSPIRPAGSNFWQAPNLRRNFKRVTLQCDREFMSSTFNNGFITMCNLQKRLTRSAFWVLLQAMFNKRKSDKIALLRLPTINKEI